MRCRAAQSELPDPFEAGLALGRQLHELAPQVILVFASARVEAWPEIHAGLMLGLGRKEARVIGCCSDGVYARSGVSDLGVAALGIHTGPDIRSAITLVRQTGQRELAAGREAAQALQAELGTPSLAFAFVDGITCDGALIAEGLCALPCPCIGGMATDSVRNQVSRIFLDGEIHEDALAVLAFRGPVRFRTCAVSGWVPVGVPGRVEESVGRTIRRISGLTAQTFVDRQFGRMVTDSELGIVPLAVRDDGGGLCLRAFQSIDLDNGWLTNRAHVPAGSTIQVCDANRQDILEAVDTVASSLSAGLPFTPACLIAISCCGRKEILGARTHQEIDRLLAPWTAELPFAGFCSGGEIGPLAADETTGTGTEFHNVTLVAVVLGT